jgi:hypothetical protein
VTGQEIISLLERQGIVLLPEQTGTLSAYSLALLTPLQRAVVCKHLSTIVEALTRQLARFLCPCCDSLCWVAPERPQVPRFWSCGSCVAWGEVRGEHRISKSWRFYVTVQ